MPKKRKRRKQVQATHWRKGDAHQCFVRGRSHSSRRGFAWTLTEPQFFTHFVRPCGYCGHTFSRGWGTGLDQKVPAAGYTKANVVPCCGECNRVKSNKYTYSEMRRLGRVLGSIKKRREE